MQCLWRKVQICVAHAFVYRLFRTLEREKRRQE